MTTIKEKKDFHQQLLDAAKKNDIEAFSIMIKQPLIKDEFIVAGLHYILKQTVECSDATNLKLLLELEQVLPILKDQVQMDILLMQASKVGSLNTLKYLIRVIETQNLDAKKNNLPQIELNLMRMITVAAQEGDRSDIIKYLFVKAARNNDPNIEEIMKISLDYFASCFDEKSLRFVLEEAKNYNLSLPLSLRTFSIIQNRNIIEPIILYAKDSSLEVMLQLLEKAVLSENFVMINLILEVPSVLDRIRNNHEYAIKLIRTMLVPKKTYFQLDQTTHSQRTNADLAAQLEIFFDKLDINWNDFDSNEIEQILEIFSGRNNNWSLGSIVLNKIIFYEALMNAVDEGRDTRIDHDLSFAITRAEQYSQNLDAFDFDVNFKPADWMVLFAMLNYNNDPEILNNIYIVLHLMIKKDAIISSRLMFDLDYKLAEILENALYYPNFLNVIVDLMQNESDDLKHTSQILIEALIQMLSDESHSQSTSAQIIKLAVAFKNEYDQKYLTAEVMDDKDQDALDLYQKFLSQIVKSDSLELDFQQVSDIRNFIVSLNHAQLCHLLANKSEFILTIESFLQRELSEKILDKWFKIVALFVLNVEPDYLDNISKLYDNPNLKNAHVLIVLLSYIENHACNSETIKSFISLFKDPEKYLQQFYDVIKSRNKIELCLELQFPTLEERTEDIATRLIQRISSHYDVVIQDGQYKNKFKRLVAYLDLIAHLIESIGNNTSSIETTVEEMFVIVAPNSLKQSKNFKQIRKFKEELKGKITSMLEISGKLSGDKEVKNKIDLYLDMAQYLISKVSEIDHESIAILVPLGVTQEDFAELATLTPPNLDADTIMPDMVAQRDGYFVCKFSREDIRGPFLGLLTGCCQHIGGIGATSAIAGYTQSDSCFYVVFKGNAPAQPINTKDLVSKRIVAQSWAWRAHEDKDIIVFDSIEMDGISDTPESEKLQQTVKMLFFDLAKKIVQSDAHTTKILAGSGGTLGQIGVDYLRESVATPINANGELIYTDAKTQFLLYSSDLELICKIAVDPIFFKKLCNEDTQEDKERIAILFADPKTAEQIYILVENFKLQFYQMGPYFKYQFLLNINAASLREIREICNFDEKNIIKFMHEYLNENESGVLELLQKHIEYFESIENCMASIIIPTQRQGYDFTHIGYDFREQYTPSHLSELMMSVDQDMNFTSYFSSKYKSKYITQKLYAIIEVLKNNLAENEQSIIQDLLDGFDASDKKAAERFEKWLSDKVELYKPNRVEFNTFLNSQYDKTVSDIDYENLKNTLNKLKATINFTTATADLYLSNLVAKHGDMDIAANRDMFIAFLYASPHIVCKIIQEQPFAKNIIEQTDEYGFSKVFMYCVANNRLDVARSIISSPYINKGVLPSGIVAYLNNLPLPAPRFKD